MRELGSSYRVCVWELGNMYRMCVRGLGSKYSVCVCVCEGTRQ